MTSSKILFYLSISFIIGIFISSIVKIPQIFLWGFLFLGLLVIITSLFLKRDYLIIAGFCILLLLVGAVRLQISEFNVENNELRKFNDKGQITLTGKIFREPDIRDNSQKLKIEIYPVKSAEGSVPPKAEQFNWVKNPLDVVLVTTSRYPEYNYLDQIKITGKLETPNETEDFSYKNYLMKDGIYSVMNFPKVELLEKEKNEGPSFVVYSQILWFKQKLRESIRNNFSPPQSSILEGTILGDNGAMSQDLKDKLNITGLRHIVAVSGTHVVILSSIIMSLLLAMGFRRGQAFYIAIIFICLYIILTGLPASGVRAGIMGGLYLLAQKLGRQSMGSRVITSACAVMLLINPLLLFYDVGFQLSFLAVLGLIYLEPLIRGFLKFIIKGFYKKDIKEKYENLFSMFSVTFAAQIFTLPVIVFNFGNISWVSPITNILVLPIVYYLMICGFLSSVAGIFSGALGWVLSIPCYVLLNYFIWVVDSFSKSWMYKTIENVSWIWLAVSYFTIALLTRFLNKRYVQKF